ncbi:cyclic peptide export ABC transporter [Chengkuizengella marina]|uniref:Cyclic peptide export ABC transporter n=1 Tax=Chengkuizengella marina TaxID=2507566 RepID=A0A6N9Q8K9_9BACL|nr:cyclic peptide export ABC transporter [Chengkuizengella marina]NBI31159.1 cyclic peptide export ABC transporter [Chengkuizengella marina]
MKERYNKVKYLLVIGLFFIFMVPSFSFAQQSVINLSENKINNIEKLINKHMDKGKMPGLSIVIVNDDQIVYQEEFGYSDIELNKKVTSKTLFELGSTSKAFTALALLNLVREEELNMDDPVSKYLPWLKMNYDGENVEVTLEQFLHHTSGVPFNSIDRIPVSIEENALEQTVKTLVDIELINKPGQNFDYATINYDVLGLVIEKVSGISFEEYIQTNLLDPLQLNQTYLFRSDALEHDLAKGYKFEFLHAREYDAPIYRGNKPAGYFISNSEDIAKWLMLQLGTLKNVNDIQELVQLSQLPNRTIYPNGDGSSYAGGWYVYQDGGGEISHGGVNPNYSSYFVFRPEEKLGVAVLSNINSAYVPAIGQEVIDLIEDDVATNKITDLNKSADRITVIIIVVATVILCAVMFLIFTSIKDIILRKRIFEKKNKKSILGFLLSIFFMVVLTYCIYLIPYIFFYGVSWEFVYIWLPITIKYALYITLVTIWMIFIYFLITYFFKNKNDKSLLLISLLSIISGLGNFLIIFTINLSINGSGFQIGILLYFTLGIILYVYGQRVVRFNLINITNNIVYTKRMEIINRLLRIPYSNFEKIKNGRIHATLNNDTETLGNFANIIIGGVSSSVTLVCCFIYLGFVSFYGLLLTIFVISLIASIYYLTGRYANEKEEGARNYQNHFFKFINDITNGFKELSLNKAKKEEFEVDVDHTCNNYRVKRGEAALAFANMFVIGELLFTVALGAVAFIFPLVFTEIQSNTLSTYIFVLLFMIGPVHGILNAIPDGIRVKISWNRIQELYHEIASIKHDDIHLDREIMANNNVVIELNQIEYVYDHEDEESNFKVGPISYKFKSGEITFITGGNGSGKSTLAKMITGLYTPSKGEIIINNKEIEGKALSQFYSTIFSDVYLFDKLYGIEHEEKEEEITKYLKLLQMENKVKIEDGKFNTIDLSTGQRKRLALLISYLEDRPVYLFDEWAADQDPEFRQFFYKTLLPDLKSRGKCIIAITHDDYYFDMADHILKLEMGIIK